MISYWGHEDKEKKNNKEDSHCEKNGQLLTRSNLEISICIGVYLGQLLICRLTSDLKARDPEFDVNNFFFFKNLWLELEGNIVSGLVWHCELILTAVQPH